MSFASKHDRNACMARSFNANRTGADRKAYRAVLKAFNAANHRAVETLPSEARIALRMAQQEYLEAMRAGGNLAASFPNFSEWQAARATP